MNTNIEYSYRALEKEISRIKDQLIKKYGQSVEKWWW